MTEKLELVETIFPGVSACVDFSKGQIFYFNVPFNLQYQAVLEMKKQFGKFFYAVLPNQYNSDVHPLVLCKAKNTGLDNKFQNMVRWERYYLSYANCIIFWLQNGVGEDCATKIHQQLGEYRGRMIYKRNIKIVVGAEKNFHELNWIQESFNEALGFEPPYKFHIHNTLVDTIKAAIKKVT